MKATPDAETPGPRPGPAPEPTPGPTPGRAGPPTVEAAAAQAAASLFRSLGDPSRLMILSHLMLGEHKVVELTEHLGLAQSTVSAHLRCLLDCGMVTVRPEGRASVYSLAVEPELLAILSAAEGLLAATGDAVVLCHSLRRRGETATAAAQGGRWWATITATRTA